MTMRDEFQGRLGDLPGDLGSPPGRPSNDRTGFDTTGTRSSPSGQSSAAIQGTLTDPRAQIYSRLLELAFKAVWGKVTIVPQPFNASNVAVLQIRPQEERTYFLVQNNSGSTMYIGIGYEPTANTGVQLPPGGVYEPLKIPQNEIYVLGSTPAGQAGVVLYANG